MEHDKLERARKELHISFGGSLDDDLLEQCAEICKNNNMSGDDLFYKWEAIKYNTAPRVFDKDSIHAIKEQLEREAAKTKAQKVKSKGNLGGILSRNIASLGRPGLRNDVSLRAVRLPEASAKSESKGAADYKKVSFTRRNASLPTKYRYMYEKIVDRSEALDDRIDQFADIVQRHYAISDLGDPAVPTQEEVTVVGRITFDSDSSPIEAVKLNEATLTLESSRAMGSGARIPLRFDPEVKVRAARKGRGGMGLFPGAIVALRGRNGGGGWFLVSEVLTLPPIGSQEPRALADEPFSMCIASAPFTSDLDLRYEPWQAALRTISTERPDVVLLIGPFIDSTHECIGNGDTDDTPTEMFNKVFLDPLRDFLDSNPGAIALLVPNVKDLLSTHAVFPQDAFESSLVNDPRIQLLPNPCHFVLNGVVFAVSSVDVLFHLRKEEYFIPMSEWHSVTPDTHEVSADDVMAGLCCHVLEQRSFYPIFPVPHNLSHDVNMDISHFGALTLDSDPDGQESLSVLVLPSRLKQFSKVIQHTTVVNPSYTSKGIIAALKFETDIANLDMHNQLQVELLRCS
ncbi:DNA polymerase alpha, subunit B [Trametopsis cervina]|nr:DNA polymerase alpha, subunit B [Trametopsis cervina]